MLRSEFFRPYKPAMKSPLTFASTIVSVFCLLSATISHAEIVGAGSTAAAPLYTKWQAAYEKSSGIRSSYQGVGSSAGIKKISEGAVDFGASDAPMPEAELKKKNLLDFPTVILGVVPFVNIPGVKAGELKLTADILTGIYSGRILKWNDAAIAQENPKLPLPNQPIVPVGRADGSGTTFTLTDYFSRVNPEWKQQFGTAFTINWPSNVVAVKGTGEVVGIVKKTPYAIGYAEYAYAIENNLHYVLLKNRDGHYVKPNAASFKEALANSGWAKTGNFEEMLTDKPGAGSWPITGGTYVYIPRVTDKPAQTAEALKFFLWAFMSGDEIANSLDYIRLPDRVQARVVREMFGVTDAKGNKLNVPIGIK
jgi:phosphate transport system substrate-binding protein